MNATDIDKINAQAARLKDAAAGVPALVAAKPNGATPPDGAHAPHLVDPEPPRATEPGATGPGTEAKAEPLGNDEAEHDAPPSAAEAEQSSEYKAQGPEAAEGEQPPSDAKPEPSPSDERHDDDDLSKLNKGAKKALRRAIA
jgi:hypothetical protein